MTRFVLALDQGTTSSRSILFDHSGTIVATAQREFTQHFPRSGWVEHDAEEIWATQAATIAEVLARARASVADIAAVGITNQRETTVLWDRASGRPVAPAIVWQDRRTADLCARLKAEGHEPEVARRTGLLLDPYFSGTKLAWLLDSEPALRTRAERGELAFGTIDSWLVYKLSGGTLHLTDASNASRTLLLDIGTGDWDEHMLELLRVPRAVLPRVVPSLLRHGEAFAVLGGHEVPLGGIAGDGDQQAALFGQACFVPGMAKNTYGTGCFMLMNTGRAPQASANRLLTTVAWHTDAHHYAVYLVPAFTGLGSPHWDAYARGTMVGLSRGTTKAHIARAALEAIAFQSAEVLMAMQRDAGQALVELRVDGGATANDLLMQFQADLLGVPVVRPKVTETTALGAAYLAGLAVGFWGSTGEVAANWQVDRRFEPVMPRDAAAARLSHWERAVARSREWHVDG